MERIKKGEGGQDLGKKSRGGGWSDENAGCAEKG